MRNRHHPRLCRACKAPMSRQEDTCWRCGTEWASEDAPRTTLRVIAGGRSARHASTAAVGHHARAVSRARSDMDRWVNEGGSLPFEAAALLGATTKR
jgi:predicted amidophosphoribosyltransferase